MDDDGNVIDEDMEPELSEDQLAEIYRHMLTARIYDERALNMQRQGRLAGTYAPHSGQEGSLIGSAYALEPEDWLFPSYREQAAQVLRGQRWADMLRYWGGIEDGGVPPEGVNNFLVSIPIATQTLHAVGTAWAAKIQGDELATIVYFGDGGTSEGDFHEAMNFAGVFDAPTVFFCQNNQYAISVPRNRQTRSETIAQKAIAYGFPGYQVDGNDALAVYRVTRNAIERARNGEGPTLIEAVTYRMSHHTTADDWTRYRSEEEVEAWKKKDPVTRMRRYLEAKGFWDDEKEEAAQEQAKQEVSEAIEEFENTPQRDIEEIFKYTYAEVPPHLQEQMEELRDHLSEQGEA
ncbi:MAG: pyruvate dehydrogenase (acetyl-transferring) E1 component subunit alpha [Candidatus Bipolaricaulia bacterium]